MIVGDISPFLFRLSPCSSIFYAAALTASLPEASFFHGALMFFQQGLFNVMSMSRAKIAKPS